MLFAPAWSACIRCASTGGSSLFLVMDYGLPTVTQLQDLLLLYSNVRGELVLTSWSRCGTHVFPLQWVLWVCDSGWSLKIGSASDLDVIFCWVPTDFAQCRIRCSVGSRQVLQVVTNSYFDILLSYIEIKLWKNLSSGKLVRKSRRRRNWGCGFLLFCCGEMHLKYLQVELLVFSSIA